MGGIFPTFSTYNKKLKTFYALFALDYAGKLRKYAILNESENISKEIAKLMEGNEVEVKICKIECDSPNLKDGVVSVEYLLAGDIKSFNPLRIVVYVK